ncbi:sulfate adenylyltransferase subunit CysN [Microvirga lotononidis]|uniref:Sulfate adenylyltransferase subunit 1 n=1 Tax=Microvirga lotononidis TaxID=864069 RepID=I4Z324_9HYPH|nr:sulfate adenylyltransferase subunit CysN [Microvirga lotononidis]EIM30616.1 sulfate adenylyltransferase, large subunit [Microvirga lotononidis]WQO30247.1 sulfate adenylyltransferase subunit CysN [Microvirga lotononidis]
MTVHRAPESFELEDYLAAQERKSLLRFITCGSVDDGKSTLIGRLLYESKRLFDDQLATLERDSRKHGTQGGEIDFSLLVDGLASEREQGITIDVAYRFFSTDRRTFIVADTPGHEQYTRNMATGASTADVAILLIDARKGITRQTRRHALLVSMLGTRHIALAINKMDLVNWSEAKFNEIVAAFHIFSGNLGFERVTAVPLSALHGDNIVRPPPQAAWYQGPTLLSYLETVEVVPRGGAEPFRLPVQWVNRPNPDFRGFAGLITSSVIRVGERVRVVPSGLESTVAGIVTFDGNLDEAVAGQSVTLILSDEVDVSRGDIIASVEQAPHVSDRIDARLFWMAREHLKEGDQFLLKLGTQTVPVTVIAVRQKIDLATLTPVNVSSLGANDIGDVILTADYPVAFDTYAESRCTGGFILINRESFDTVAIGLVSGLGHSSQDQTEVDQSRAQKTWLKPPSERPWRSVLKAISWRITGSLDTMVVAFFFTQNVRLSAAIGATEVLTKLVLYYGHERLWDRIMFGLIRSGDGPR